MPFVLRFATINAHAQTDTANLKTDTTKLLVVGPFKPPYVTLNKVHTFVKYLIVVTSKDGQKAYPVSSFNMTVVKKGGNIQAFPPHSGGIFSLEMKQYLQYANIDDMIYFSNIIFINDHKKLMKAKPVSFQVISEQ